MISKTILYKGRKSQGLKCRDIFFGKGTSAVKSPVTTKSVPRGKELNPRWLGTIKNVPEFLRNSRETKKSFLNTQEICQRNRPRELRSSAKVSV